MESRPPASRNRPIRAAWSIFGATGDLTHRLLLPALYNLATAGLLPEPFAIVGATRDEQSDEALRRALSEGLETFATRPLDRDVVKQLLDSGVPGARRSERAGELQGA